MKKDWLAQPLLLSTVSTPLFAPYFGMAKYLPLSLEQIFTYCFCIFMSYLEESVTRLNTLPQETSRRLRMIQDLDKKLQEMQKELEERQTEFYERFRQQRGKKTDNRTKEQLEAQYREILKLQKVCVHTANEKVRIAEYLYDLVHEPTEKLEVELNKLKTDLRKTNQFESVQGERETNLRRRRVKQQRKTHSLDGQDFDKNEPVYCYCGRPSFGEMVMCENSLCEKEWFHRECIVEKILPEKWFCSDCRKTRERKRQTRALY